MLDMKPSNTLYSIEEAVEFVDLGDGLAEFLRVVATLPGTDRGTCSCRLQ